ncbi:Uncharacterized protein YcnI [Geodermatophilus aquaeductus]|uniref:Uncharacterized protein YcnI n=1 Tax=Geodermatophilus aquaeductus TaxID=1564161 RepID=A0A521FJC0_9ACTN|nr:Uncharacterized protein YcnI [Geodermatophilus aquaeductus]
MSSLCRRVRRSASVLVLSLGVVVVGAGPAGAHVEASAEGAQAGAGPLTVSFLAEAESSTAGIVGAQVQLPEGLPPASATLASAPAGWAMTPTADGYEVAGPDIGAGVDLEYSVVIDRLPQEAPAELPFKTLLRYSDGVEDAWIEVPFEGNPEPENPAPSIAVAPAAAPVTTPAPATESAAPSTAATESSPSRSAAPEAAAADDGGLSTGAVVALAAVAAAALAGGLWFLRRRSSHTGR